MKSHNGDADATGYRESRFNVCISQLQDGYLHMSQLTHPAGVCSEPLHGEANSCASSGVLQDLYPRKQGPIARPRLVD